MSAPCDLCRKPIEPGEPRYGGPGDGGRSGPRFGSSRHWACHTAKFGRAEPAVLAIKRPSQPIGLTPAKAPKTPAQRILAPKVLRGPYNRSLNAARDWRGTGRVVSEMGKRRIEIECPFCFQEFWAFVWSLSGSGKRCPNCGAMHSGHGIASPIEGNEDLGDLPPRQEAS